MDGYIKSINDDGYAIVRPFNALRDGYYYNVIHNGNIICTTIAVHKGYRHNLVLAPIDNEHPLSKMMINDIIEKIIP